MAWRVPWYANAIAATVTFQLDPIFSFFEGCGFVANVARLRFLPGRYRQRARMVGAGLHHGLLAPAMMIVGTASTAGVWLFGKRKLLLGLLRCDPGSMSDSLVAGSLAVSVAHRR